MRVNPDLLPSATVEWATPQQFFDALDAEFGPFTVDVAANAWNAKCAAFFTEEQDGLQQIWTGRVWCNPPYGPGIDKWVAKGWEAVRDGHAQVAVLFVPARTDTRWWHDVVMAHASEVRFIRGRVKFGGKGGAPFPSCVVVFAPFASEDRSVPK